MQFFVFNQDEIHILQLHVNPPENQYPQQHNPVWKLLSRALSSPIRRPCLAEPRSSSGTVNVAVSSARQAAAASPAPGEGPPNVDRAMWV